MKTPDNVRSFCFTQLNVRIMNESIFPILKQKSPRKSMSFYSINE